MPAQVRHQVATLYSDLENAEILAILYIYNNINVIKCIIFFLVYSFCNILSPMECGSINLCGIYPIMIAHLLPPRKI